MPVVMILVFGLALGLDGIVERLTQPRWRYALIAGFAVIAAALLIPAQYDFVHTLTHDTTGQEMIALAKHVPRQGGTEVFMLPWGPRYAAVAFSKYVTGENADLPITTHNGDFASMAKQGDSVYTDKDTFYQFPLSWWDQKMGHVYLTSAGDDLVAIRTTPLTQTTGQTQPVGHGVIMHGYSVCSDDNAYHLTITWGAASKPDADLSVFAKLFQNDIVVVGPDGKPVQADSDAPVYGQYPTSRWSANEVVYDNYVLPRLPQATNITFGMYLQQPDGSFVNYGTTKVPVAGIMKCQ
jgi:hypothetical protein